MRTGNVLFSIVHLFMSFLILGLGILFLILPYASSYRHYLSDLLIDKPFIFMRCGMILTTCGVILFAGLYVLNRRRYYKIKLDEIEVSTSEKMVKNLILRFWKRLFPEEKLPQDIYLNLSKEIELIIPSSKSFKEEESFLEKIQEELGTLLLETIGYRKKIIINLC